MSAFTCAVCGEFFEDEDDGFVHVLTHPDRSDFEIERGVAVRVKRDQSAEAARLVPPVASPPPPSEAPAPSEAAPEASPVEQPVPPSPVEDDPTP